MNRHCPNYSCPNYRMHYYKLYKCGFYDLNKLIDIYNDYEKNRHNWEKLPPWDYGSFCGAQRELKQLINDITI